jgi:outer membrane lipopolysaccharide assembly protein LptE/RlpB
VSDTPRTDNRTVIIDGNQWVNAPFARQLERELNAANVEIERLKKSNLQLREGAEEQKQRIKRLEEAGDAMEQWTSEYGPIYRWRKAKEDKL